MNEFKEYIDNFIEGRIEDIWEDLRNNNEEYQAYKNQTRQLQYDLKNKADEEVQAIFAKYEDSINKEDKLIFKEIYSRALEDGIKLSAIIDEYKGKGRDEAKAVEEGSL